MIKATKVVIRRPRELVLEEFAFDSDQVAADEVVAETVVSAISPGTELAAYTGAPPLRPSVQYPRLVGYCNVARVLAAGPGVDDLSGGSRILTFSSHCSHFRIKRSDVLAKLSEDVRSEDAALAYLYHLGYSAVLRADLRLGATAVVVGLGVLGLTSVALAAMAGATVYAISEHEASHALARKFGAKGCFTRAQSSNLLDALGAGLANAVISTSNSWADWSLALQAVGQQGVIAVLGFPGRGAASIPNNPLDSQYFYQKQVKILAAGASPELPDSRGFLPYNERKNLVTILDWTRAGTIRPADLVAGTFPSEKIERAYQQLLSGIGAPGTLLLRWCDRAVL